MNFGWRQNANAHFPFELEVAKPRPIERNLPRREGRSKRRGTEGRIPGLPAASALNKKFGLKEANEEDTTYYTSAPSALTREKSGSKFVLYGLQDKCNAHLQAHIP